MSDQSNPARTLAARRGPERGIAVAAREAVRITAERYPGLDLPALVDATTDEHPEFGAPDVKAAVIALLNRGILIKTSADGRVSLAQK